MELSRDNLKQENGMQTTLQTRGALIGAIVNRKVERCTIIGALSSVSNKVLIKLESSGKIFAITPNLVVWVNEGLR